MKPILLFCAQLICAASIFAQADYELLIEEPNSAGGASPTTNTWVTSVTGGFASAPGGDTESGFKITVGASDIVVTDLGVYFETGTYADVLVKLRNSSCTVLASATVADGGGSIAELRWAPTLGTAITLTAGQVYYITRDHTGFNEILQGASYTTTSAATLNSGANESCADPSYTAGVNFKYYVP